jgi:hypothetical protein
MNGYDFGMIDKFNTRAFSKLEQVTTLIKLGSVTLFRETVLAIPDET